MMGTVMEGNSRPEKLWAMGDPIEQVLRRAETLLLCQVGSKKGQNMDFVLVTRAQMLREVYEIAEEYFPLCRISDDCVQLEMQGQIWSFAVYTEKQLEKRLEDIFALRVYGEMRPWALGYWIPEGFLQDLMMGRLLFGSSEAWGMLYSALQERWAAYRQALAEKIRQELASKRRMLRGLEPDSFWHRRLTSDIILAEERLNNLERHTGATGFHHMNVERR